MLAYRTDEVVREFLAYVFISANKAFPDGLTLRSCAYGLGLWLDVVLIVFISAGLGIGKDFHI